jgi:hypothetical protein
MWPLTFVTELSEIESRERARESRERESSERGRTRN